MGAGLEAEEFMYNCYVEHITIDFIIDNYITGEFHNCKIYKLDEVENINNYFIVVACKSKETYLQIKDLLGKRGLNEFDNFIWFRMWNKKIIAINANCHGTALKKYLTASDEFNLKFAIYPIPELQNNFLIEDNILKNVDVYIHQDIRAENKVSYYLSDEFILTRLKQDCQRICIPNFVGFGKMFFQTVNEGGYVANRQVLMFYRDNAIDQCVEKDKECSLDELKDMLNDLRIDEEETHKKFNEYMIKIKKREKNWDIKVSEYIEENYKYQKLMNDIDHPSNLMMKYICDQVAEHLEIEPVGFDCFDLGVETFLQPRIKEVLGMDFEEKEVEMAQRFPSGKKKINYDDYLRQYVWLHENIII